jgi:hypothetical protein
LNSIHDDVEILAVFKELPNLHYIWVIEGLHHEKLLNNISKRSNVLRIFLKDLNGNARKSIFALV